MIIRLFPPYPCITYNDDTSSHRSASRKRPKTVFSATLLCRLQLRFTTLFSQPLRSVDYVSIALQRFLLFSNAGRAQRWYLAGTMRVETISRLSGSLLTSKLISAYTQGRVGRNAELGHDSGFLKAKRVFFIRQRLIRLLRCNFLYLPKAHTIIALQFSLFAKSSYDYCAVIFDLLNHFLPLRFA